MPDSQEDKSPSHQSRCPRLTGPQGKLTPRRCPATGHTMCPTLRDGTASATLPCPRRRGLVAGQQSWHRLACGCLVPSKCPQLLETPHRCYAAGLQTCPGANPRVDEGCPVLAAPHARPAGGGLGMALPRASRVSPRSSSLLGTQHLSPVTPKCWHQGSR